MSPVSTLIFWLDFLIYGPTAQDTYGGVVVIVQGTDVK
jgi:hypothetical protein